jgi:hypothetical protein
MMLRFIPNASTIAQGLSQIWIMFSSACSFGEWNDGGRYGRRMITMSDKKATKEIERATLARVQREMALPRMTKSAREALLAIARS